jgi:hypothetical protein
MTASEQKTSKRRPSSTTYSRQYRKSHPEMRYAWHAVYQSIRNGRLVKPSECSLCGSSQRIQAHHHKGYDRAHWQDVVWLCRACHIAEDIKARRTGGKQ